MSRRVAGDGSGFGRLFGKLTEKLADAVQAPPKREKRIKPLGKDSRRGMSGRARMAAYGGKEPMTLQELLARLLPDQREAVLAMSVDQQAELLAVYEALDRRLQAPGSHKAAVLEHLGRMMGNGRLIGDRRGNGGLLRRLAARVDASPAGPLRGRMDGLLYLSFVVLFLAEPQPGPVTPRNAPEQAIAALTNSMALTWPAGWGGLALDLAFDGAWQGVLPILRVGGSPPDGLVQGSLLAFAKAVPPDNGDAPSPEKVDDLTIAQFDVIARFLEMDRGAELDVEGRDPLWALGWLQAQLDADVPARAGIMQGGKGRTVQVRHLSGKGVVCDGLTLSNRDFLASLRRVVVDGDYLSRIGLG